MSDTCPYCQAKFVRKMLTGPDWYREDYDCESMKISHCESSWWERSHKCLDSTKPSPPSEYVMVRREDLIEAIWVLSHGYTTKYDWADRLKAALEEKL